MSADWKNGLYVGYDPGGDNRHGVAALEVADGVPVRIETVLLSTAEAVLEYFLAQPITLRGLGIDSLTCWSTGPAGWRPADRWLREHYPAVRNSIASPNSLYGAMALNGMAVMISLRNRFRNLPITETHPKVVHQHMQRVPYDYIARSVQMNEALTRTMGITVTTSNDHEWDAAVSAMAAFRTAAGAWTQNLHLLPTEVGERLVFPCGVTEYSWPQ